MKKTAVKVKGEPIAVYLPPATSHHTSASQPTVKACQNNPEQSRGTQQRHKENYPARQKDHTHPVKLEERPISVSQTPVKTVRKPATVNSYTRFRSSSEIVYVPEEALRQGLKMVSAIRSGVKTLELGNKMRKEVWMREIESLQQQAAPTTMIAICGATGAGKSSTLNALLDDNIVPTSGMRACTAVVTEISYHDNPNIEGDVAFLTEEEWKAEIEILLDDLVEEDGVVKRVTDLRSDAGVAWSKLHAVYPAIAQDMLVDMDVEDILQRDARIRGMLGTTRRVVAPDSKTFSEEIARYIDSKEKKRGNEKKSKGKGKSKGKNKKGKDTKGKGKDGGKKKSGQSSLMDLVMKKGGKGRAGAKKDDVTVPKSAMLEKTQNDDTQPEEDGPAYWPLIRQVRVRCKASALATGAILVDLPGVADANAARNSIAKDYMKKCDCIWILAPVTRAVDDKTARDLLGDAFKTQLMMDGNYDQSTITFVATKCDDISCSEVIPALNLEDDPELLDIEAQIDQAEEELEEARGQKEDAIRSLKDIKAGLKKVRTMQKGYKTHLSAFQSGKQYKRPSASSSTKTGSKRKPSGGGRGGCPKRRKGDESSDGSESNSGDDEYDDGDSNAEGSSTSDEGIEADSDASEGSDDDSTQSSESGSGDEEDEDEEFSMDDLKEKITECQAAIKAGLKNQKEAKKEHAEALEAFNKAKRDKAMAQKDKNAFCSLKRSAYSEGVLKNDFRAGLKEIDDAAEEERDSYAFDPAVDIRDYATIDLPVFTISSRDYVRINGQVEGDGDPTCFSDAVDTGIPALQDWCHSLTVTSRERSARSFFHQFRAFLDNVRIYVTGIGEVTPADRQALRDRWESTPGEEDDSSDSSEEDTPEPTYATTYAALYAQATGGHKHHNAPGLFQMTSEYSLNRSGKVDADGNAMGITPELVAQFNNVVDHTVESLNEAFRDGLDEKCRNGARDASAAAVKTHDIFAADVHWHTYRATIRRLGEFRKDLNAELTLPMTRQIASSWAMVFEEDLFSGFQRDTERVVQKLLKDIGASAPNGLKDKVQLQGETAMNEAKLALQNATVAVKNAMDAEQKEISRCLAPYIRSQLQDTYLAAYQECGPGSVSRQKTLIHDFIKQKKDEIFSAGSDLLLERLSTAAKAVGQALDTSLAQLAQKIETNLSVLWEEHQDSPEQVKSRTHMVRRITDIVALLDMWEEANEARMNI